VSGDAKQVSIGGRPYTVARFSTYKALLVAEVVTKVTQEARELFKEAQDFRREYREENPLQITRQMCMERVAELESAETQCLAKAEDAPVDVAEDSEDLSRQDWIDRGHLMAARKESWKRQLDDMGDRAYVEMPQDPDDTEVILAVFPKAFQMKEQLIEVLALVVTPDADLEAEWHKDSVHTKLKKIGEDLIKNSEPEEIVELSLAAKEVVGDQFRPLVGKFRTLWEVTQETPQPEPPQTPQPTPPSQPPPTSSLPTSSTSSEEPTDGPSKSPSLESRGEPASLSPAA